MSDRSPNHLDDLRKTYSHADPISKDPVLTCFNVKGDKYRLISLINYETQTVVVIEVLTHAEYTKKYSGGHN